MKELLIECQLKLMTKAMKNFFALSLPPASDNGQYLE